MYSSGLERNNPHIWNDAAPKCPQHGHADHGSNETFQEIIASGLPVGAGNPLSSSIGREQDGCHICV